MKKELSGNRFSLLTLGFQMEGMGWLGLFLGFAGLGAALGLLAVSGWFITAAGVAAMHLASLQAFNFLQPAAAIRFLALFRTVALYGERIVSHDGILRLLAHLRIWLFDRLAAAERSRLSDLGSGDLMHGMLSDIDLLDQWPIRGLAPWIWALGLNLALLGFLFFLFPHLVPVFAVFLLLVFLVLPILAPWRNLALAAKATKNAALRRQFLLEGLAGLLTLKTTGAFGSHFEKWHRMDRDVLDTGWKLACHQVFLQTVILFLLFLMLWLILLKNGKPAPLPEAALIAGLVCAILGLADVMLPLAGTFQALGFTLKAKERLFHLGGGFPEEGERQGKALAGALRLEIKELSVRQKGALAGPENVSFLLSGGDLLWVDGPSGCGKTTLGLALSGWLAPERGEILFRGIPLAEISERDLRKAIGFLEQMPHFFSMGLGENLRLAGADLPENALWEVLDFVFLGDWARSLPMGLDTPIGEYGRGLSGGQARRLALARLLLFSPDILILDEPFEGLDRETTEALLQRLVKRQEAGILIVISHQRWLKETLPGILKIYTFQESEENGFF